MINFPVPKNRLSAMILALARIIEEEQRVIYSPKASSETDSLPGPTSEVEKEQIQIEWDEEKLRNLRKLLDNPAAIALLDMTASMPNERVYVADEMKKLECSHGKVGAGLGVLTKRITKMPPCRRRRTSHSDSPIEDAMPLQNSVDRGGGRDCFSRVWLR